MIAASLRRMSPVFGRLHTGKLQPEAVFCARFSPISNILLFRPQRSHRKTIPCRQKWLCRHGCEFKFRLAGYRVWIRCNERINPRQIGVRVVPMHRRKDRALLLLLAYQGTQNNFTTIRGYAHQRSGGNSRLPRISRMNFDEWFADMSHEPCRFSRARHGVPLVANAARVQHQGKCVRSCSFWFPEGRCNKIGTSSSR